MNICFLVEMMKDGYPTMWAWDDGLRGAMKIIEKEHHVCYHLNGELEHGYYGVLDKDADVVMVWSGTGGKVYKEALEFEGKKILFFAGGPRNPELFKNFDMVLFENDLHTLEARSQGVKCMTAFGTDTTIFKPIKQKKVFDVIYPGAFGLWKRKDLFAKATKRLRAFTLGNIQEHERQCYDVCVESDIAVSADIPQSRLPYFMAMAHTVCVLPVDHIGGQRTVLEAMAMKLPIIVPSDAPLVCEFAQHGGTICDSDPVAIENAIVSQIGKVNEKGYEYVMENMTEKHYAKKIQVALERIC